MTHLVEIRSQLGAVWAHLTILGLSFGTSTAQGKLMLNLLGTVADFEREIMLERQREGIAKAKAGGKYRGRKPTALAKSNEVLALAGAGVGGTMIAQDLEISRALVYRILNAGQS